VTGNGVPVRLRTGNPQAGPALWHPARERIQERLIEGRGMAHGLAAPRRLNFDYLGTQLGQIGGAGRTEDILRTGEHTAALQRLGLAESLLEVECLVAEFFKSRRSEERRG